MADRLHTTNDLHLILKITLYILIIVAGTIILSAVNKAPNSTVAKKLINSGVAKQVLDSTVNKTLAENINNFFSNSAISKQMKKTLNICF